MIFTIFFNNFRFVSIGGSVGTFTTHRDRALSAPPCDAVPSSSRCRVVRIRHVFFIFFFFFFKSPRARALPKTRSPRCYGDRPFHEIGRPFTFPRSSQSTKIDKKKISSAFKFYLFKIILIRT